MSNTIPLISAGLDSISAIELVRRLGEHFDLSLPATLLFDHPSTSDIASFISGCLPQQEVTEQ